MSGKLVLVMTLIVLIGMLTLAFNLQPVECSEPPPTEWTKTYGGADDDDAYSVVETDDGGYALAGYTYSFGAGEGDFWLVRVDSAGNHEWNKTYGGGGGDYARSVVETGDGGYALAGSTHSFGAGGFDAWLVKVDSAGNMEWNKTYGGANWDYARSVVEIGDGGYALAGYTDSFGAGFHDAWLVKVDSAGNMEWNKTYGGADFDHAVSVVETGDGGYALAGSTHSFGVGGDDAWLVKVDSAGNMEWNKTYGGADDDYAYSVLETDDGGYAFAGYTQSFGAGDRNAWLVKVDSSGNHEWNRTYSVGVYDVANSFAQTGNGGYALAGTTVFFEGDDFDSWLVKVDSAGNMEWNKTYGGADFDHAVSVVETGDGGYALAGYTQSFGVGGDDAWLVKVGVTAKIFPVVVDSTDYAVTVNSNSTVSDFNFNKAEMQISFSVTGESGTTGYCNVTIPKSLLTGSPWTIKIDDTPITAFDEKTNDTHTFLYVIYTHESPLQVTIEGTWVVPEFPSALILPLFMIATLLAVTAYRRKHSM